MASNMDETLPDWVLKIKDIPVLSLSNSARHILNVNLGPDVMTVTDSGLKQNWEGFAELCGCNHQLIRHYGKDKDPLLRVIENWETKTSSTIEKLISFLIKLEFETLLRDSRFQGAVERGVELYNEDRSGADDDSRRHFERSGPFTSIHRDENDFDPEQGIDVRSVREGKTVIYDAFVCYSEKDMKFVRELIEKLERKRPDEPKLSLCIRQRDLIVGTAENSVTAQMIKDRCRRVIIVLSKNFLRSPQCDFQLKFAQHLSPGCRSKKLIPVIIEDIGIPNILSFITRVDFVKDDLRDWNWDRLYASVKAPFHLLPGENQDQGDLNQIKLDLDESESSSDPVEMSSSSCVASSSSTSLPAIIPVSVNSSCDHQASWSSEGKIICAKQTPSSSTPGWSKPAKPTDKKHRRKHKESQVLEKSSQNGISPTSPSSNPLEPSEPSEVESLIDHFILVNLDDKSSPTAPDPVPMGPMNKEELTESESVSLSQSSESNDLTSVDSSKNSGKSSKSGTKKFKFKNLFKK